MKRYYRTVLLAGLVSLFSISAWCRANLIQYTVTVDTSSVTGDGYIDLEFNNSGLFPSYQLATLDISNFQTDGTLDTFGDDADDFTTPDVTGTLPGTLSFTNQSSSTDYTQGLTFGSFITFNIDLFGPAVGAAADGSGVAVFQLDFGNADFTQNILVNDPDDSGADAPYDTNVGLIFLDSTGDVTPEVFPNLGGGASAGSFVQTPLPTSAMGGISLIAALAIGRAARRGRVST